MICLCRLDEVSPTVVPKGTPDIPECKDAVDLDFSMDTFPHLQVRFFFNLYIGNLKEIAVSSAMRRLLASSNSLMLPCGMFLCVNI